MQTYDKGYDETANVHNVNHIPRMAFGQSESVHISYSVTI